MKANDLIQLAVSFGLGLLLGLQRERTERSIAGIRTFPLIIHMSDIASFPYGILWADRSGCSGATLTRRNGEEFLALAPCLPVRTEVETFPLIEANEALALLRAGRLRGAAVLDEWFTR